MAEAGSVQDVNEQTDAPSQQQEPQQVDAHVEDEAHGEAGSCEQPAEHQGNVTEAETGIAASAPAAAEETETGHEAAAELQAEAEPPALHPAVAEAAAEAAAKEAAEAQPAQQQQEEAQQEGLEEVQREHGDVPQHAHQHAAHQHTRPAAAAGSLGRTAGANKCAGADKGLTFSGPPYVPKAKPYKRMDYSHSAVELMKIAHDNELLVKQLTTISKAVPAWSKDVAAPPAPGNTASSAINRRKAATVIAQENHALYQRLVSIKPSKDISRQTLEAEHRQNEIYRNNCAQFKQATGRASPTPTQ